MIFCIISTGDATFGGSETWRRRMLGLIKYFRVVHTIWPRLWKSIQRNIKISPNLRMPNGVLVEWIARSYLRLDCSFSLSYEITLCNLATSFELSGGRLLRWKSLGPQWKHPIGGLDLFLMIICSLKQLMCWCIRASAGMLLYTIGEPQTASGSIVLSTGSIISISLLLLLG